VGNRQVHIALVADNYKYRKARDYLDFNS